MRSRSAPALLLAAVVALAGGACGSDDKDAPETASSTTVVNQATTSSVAPTTTSATVDTAPVSVTMAGQTVTTARLRAVFAGLCQAAGEAAADVATAEKTFQGKSHDGLHLIARGLQDIDRAASAALLEAKQKVEADFSGHAAGSQVAADLRTLSEVTRSSLARFKVTVDACPATS